MGMVNSFFNSFFSSLSLFLSLSLSLFPVLFHVLGLLFIRVRYIYTLIRSITPKHNLWFDCQNWRKIHFQFSIFSWNDVLLSCCDVLLRWPLGILVMSSFGKKIKLKTKDRNRKQISNNENQKKTSSVIISTILN